MIYNVLQSLKIFLLAVICTVTSINSYAQVDYTIGTGTTDNGQYGLPTPFEDFYDGDRQQFLFRASELTAVGMGPGLITAIKWNVNNKYSQRAIPGYEITIGTTTLNDLSGGWATGITTPVFSVGSTGTYTVTTGINAFTLPTPMVWNGTDNIVIQVCHGSTVAPCYTYTNCAAVNYTNTPFVSTRYNRQDCSGSLCNNTTGYSLTSPQARPNTIFTYGVPCTGTPNGYTVNAPYEVCPGKQFTVGLTGSFLSNLTHDWEYSNDGTTWIAYGGTVGINGQITDVIQAPRWYRCKITCTNSGLSFTTPPAQVRIAPFYYCYCDAAPTTAPGLDIGNVKVINLTSGDTVLNNGNSTPALNNATANKTYTTFQFPPVPQVVMYRDTTYRFLVSQINSTATFKPSFVAIFIDLDRNGTFDFGEKVMEANINGGSAIANTESATFKIPTAAQIGFTGMRVVLSSGKVDSCGFGMTEGEVEDYLVDMRYEPCKGPGNPGTLVSTSNKLCTGYDYITQNNGYETTKSELTRVWQISGDNVFWSTIAGSADKDTLMRVFNGQPLYYKVRMICPRTKDTSYSSSMKIDAREGYKCYCYSQAIGGNPKDSQNPKDSSDIGGIVFHTFNTNTGGAHLLNQYAQEKRTDYTDNAPMMLDVDSTYQLTVYHTLRTPVHGDAKVTVFMDFNNNKEYDAPYERVYTGYTNVGSFTIVDKITIPSTVITGVPTGMRVILNNNISPNIPSDQACGAYTSGETEDLMVQFVKRFPASVSNVSSIDNFGMFPNPTTGKFRLQFASANALNDVTVSITNITGQVVMQQTVKHNGGTFTQDFDLSNKARGVYVVELRSADGVKAVQRLVID